MSAIILFDLKTNTKTVVLTHLFRQALMVGLPRKPSVKTENSAA